MKNYPFDAVLHRALIAQMSSIQEAGGNVCRTHCQTFLAPQPAELHFLHGPWPFGQICQQGPSLKGCIWDRKQITFTSLEAPNPVKMGVGVGLLKRSKTFSSLDSRASIFTAPPPPLGQSPEALNLTAQGERPCDPRAALGPRLRRDVLPAADAARHR